MRTPPNVNSGTLSVWLDPTSIISSSGVITKWRNLANLADTCTISGSPSLDTTGFTEPGVAFDGVNDYIESTLNLSSDQPITIFTLSKELTQFSGYASILSLSDNGSAARENELIYVYTNHNARQNDIAETGDAGYVFTSTAVTLHRIIFDQNHRAIFENGMYKASNIKYSDVVRDPTKIRLGCRFDGSLPWHGSIYMVLVYQGELSQPDARTIENWIMRRAGITLPYSYPNSLSQITDLSTDPRLLLANKINAITNRKIELFKNTSHYRDGWTEQSLNADLNLDVVEWNDRWQITGREAGSFEFELHEGDYSVLSELIVKDMPITGTKNILVAGDSNAARGAIGWIQILKNILGDRAEFVGTQGPWSGAYDVKHEGHDSWSWATFNSISSPFYYMGSWNLTHYLSLLDGYADGYPDVIVWMLGANDIYGSSDTTIDANITTAFAHAEVCLSKWTEILPNVKHIMLTPPPSAGDPVVYGNTHASYLQTRRNQHRMHERMIGQFSGKEESNIFVLPIAYRFDDALGYDDPVHLNKFPGHNQFAEAVLGEIIARI